MPGVLALCYPRATGEGPKRNSPTSEKPAGEGRGTATERYPPGSRATGQGRDSTSNRPLRVSVTRVRGSSLPRRGQLSCFHNLKTPIFRVGISGVLDIYNVAIGAP